MVALEMATEIRKATNEGATSFALPSIRASLSPSIREWYIFQLSLTVQILLYSTLGSGYMVHVGPG